MPRLRWPRAAARRETPIEKLEDFEGIKLRLADNTFYTPDFAVMSADGVMECHEVKGFWQDDARAKIKVAADLYPFRFVAIKAKAKKDGGGWALEEF